MNRILKTFFFLSCVAFVETIFPTFWQPALAQTADAPVPNNPTLNGYEVEFPAMGSTFNFSIYAADEAEVLAVADELQAEVLRLNQIFSDYDPNSELERLLAAEDSSTVDLSPDLFALLLECERWYKETGGAFDASVGKLTKLWRNAKKENRIPSKSEIGEALLHVGWDKVKLLPDRRKILIRDSELEIDFGGIATGYTVDRCFEMLIAKGLHHSLINSGGDIRCGEAPPGRDGWNIEVAAIERGGDALRHLVLKNCSVTTSGDLWRYVEIEGVRRSHIVDPRTGYGIPGPMSVTVIAETCLEVDVLGTTLSVLGEQKGLQFLSKSYARDAEAFFVWQSADKGDLQMIATEGFPAGTVPVTAR